MTIRKKIIVGFLITSILGLILGLTGFASTKILTGLSDELHLLQKTSAGVSSVLNAHYIWRQGLTEAVLTGGGFTGSIDPESCALGKWKSSDEAKAVTDAEILSLLAQVDSPHNYIHSEAKTIIAMLEAGQTDEARNHLVDNVLPKTAEVISILTAMEERYTTLTEEKSAEIISTGDTTVLIIVILIALVFAMCAVLSTKITSGVMNPLRKITAAAQKIATGDLDVDVEYHINDQIGELAKSFQSVIESTKIQLAATSSLASGDLTVEIHPRSDKDAMNAALKKMIENLNNMFGKIHDTSEQVASGSKQVAIGSQSLAQGSAEQASSIEELSATISEISEKTSRNAKIAREAATLSDTIKISAEKGSTQMENMMQAVKEINDASGEIEKVIKVIEDIAFQTNILALNAAVEAARAGAAGKGFAVVAEEVRNLAAKSAEAAKDTGGLIENSVSKATLGMTIANETSDSLSEIVEGINRSAEIIEQIAKSSDEQVGAISQTNIGIEQVAQVVQRNSATAEESAAASEEMSGHADILREIVGQFKLK